MNAQPLLRIRNLDSWYGELHIMKCVNMDIHEGELVSIIGPNGSGKSTTLKCITGLVEKKTGKIFFERKNISKKQPHEVTRLGISIVPQGRRVFPTMTVQDNLEMGGFILDTSVMRKRLKTVYTMFPELKKWKHKRATFLSGGQQQLLSIGRAMMLKPKLLLLDEPSLGLSPIAMQDIFRKIIQIKKMGVTIILVEQNARAALAIADRAYVLELGKNKLTGTGKSLLNDKRVSRLYLGGD